MSSNRRQRRSGVKLIPILPNDEGRFPSHGEMTRLYIRMTREQTKKLGEEKSQAHKIRHLHR